MSNKQRIYASRLFNQQVRIHELSQREIQQLVRLAYNWKVQGRKK